MNTLFPSYKNKFACLAGKCPDSCCKAWEICIDEATEKYYRALPGEFGDRLRSALSTDEDGESCFRLKDGRCPFLDREGLCEIHIKLGEERTSEVCRQHPLFIEEYDCFTEVCPSLSCPAAAELIFSEDLSEKVYPFPRYDEYGGDDELLYLLIPARKTALAFAARLPFAESAGRIYAMLTEWQDEWDVAGGAVTEAQNVPEEGVRSGAELPEEYSALFAEYTELLSSGVEILTEKWRTAIKKAPRTVPHRAYTEEEDKNVRRAFRYFLYRYMLKSVNDEDILLWGTFCILSVDVCRVVAESGGIPFEEAARLYAKEIEHDPVNMELIADLLFEYVG